MAVARQRVTIAAIAEAAGVSVPTVSRVLNGRSDVSPQTRELIERLLREHDYRPRNSRHSGRARLVDLVFNDLDSPWALELVRGVEDVTHAAGVGTVVSQVHRRTTATRQWLQNLRARASDGVIFVTSDVAEPVHSELHRLRVPVVIIDPAGGAATDVPTIGATNWSGGRTATDHLIGLGHRRIGFIAGPKDLLCSRARLDGFRAAMEAAGVPLDPDLMEQGNFLNESGYLAGGRLLDLPDRPTAIFASSDQMAFGVY